MVLLLRIFKITLVFLTISTHAFGQEWEWVKSAGGNGYDKADDMGVDAEGNSYVTGWFDETISFDNFKLVNKDKEEFNALYDIFIAKYNNKGQVLWVRKAGGGRSDRGHAIAVDAAGNSYITGSIQDEASFGSITLKSKGLNNAFIAKYDTYGNVIWAVNTNGYYSEARGITIDASGNCFITGWFKGTINFGSTVLTSDKNEGKFFVAKFDAKGNFVWAKGTTGDGQAIGMDLSADKNGSCYVTGLFYSSITVDDILLQPSGAGDMFLLKYDQNGKVLWARKSNADASYFAVGNNVALDNAGNCYVTGNFRDEIKFEDKTLSGNGQEDVFLAKYDAAGKLLWVHKAGGEGSDSGHSIVIDAEDQVTIAGSFCQTIQFGSTTLLSEGEEDIFVAHYSSDGQAVWAMQAGGISMDGSLSQGNGIGMDGQGNFYIAGSFGETATFGSNKIINQGSNDIYIAKIITQAIHEVIPPVVPEIIPKIVPFISLHALSITSYCLASTTTVSFTATGDFDSGNNFTVQLSDARGSFASPVIIGTGTKSPISVTIPVAVEAGSNYRIRVLASSPSVASDDNGVSLTINSLPLIRAGANESVCISAASFSLNGFSPAGGTWSGKGVNAVGIFNPALAMVGTHTVTYTVQVGACTASSSKTILVSAQPIITAAVVPTSCELKAQGMKFAPYKADFTNHTSGATSYLWEFGDGATSTEATPTHLYPATGNFEVFLTAFNGTDCSQKQQVTKIWIEEKKPLPNIITPNGDGRNDAFVVQLSCLDLNLKVFNRAGRLVYEQANYQNTWQGENLADGTYYYQLSAANGLSWKGWVEINR